MTDTQNKKWTSGKPFVVTPEQTALNWGSSFGCMLCGHMFKAGDTARWVYTNHGKWRWRGGNFFVCGQCDDAHDQNGEAIANAAWSVIETVRNNPVMKNRFLGENQ